MARNVRLGKNPFTGVEWTMDVYFHPLDLDRPSGVPPMRSMGVFLNAKVPSDKLPPMKAIEEKRGVQQCWATWDSNGLVFQTNVPVLGRLKMTLHGFEVVLGLSRTFRYERKRLQLEVWL
jgi:hypothetical protein